MSLEEYYARRKAYKQKQREMRDAGRRKWSVEVKRLMKQVRKIVPECGLTQTQLSNLSGVVKSTLSRIMKTRHESARFDTIVRLLAVAGYKFEIVPIDPHDDEYRDMRRLRPKPLEK